MTRYCADQLWIRKALLLIRNSPNSRDWRGIRKAAKQLGCCKAAKQYEYCSRVIPVCLSRKTPPAEANYLIVHFVWCSHLVPLQKLETIISLAKTTKTLLKEVMMVECWLFFF